MSDIIKTQRSLAIKAEHQPQHKFDHLYRLICRSDWIKDALDAVLSNQGSKTAGIDGMTRKALASDTAKAKFAQELETKLRQKQFRPMPVRRVYIPKSNGKKRPLGIPTIADRVVQMLLKMVLEPIYESDFLNCSNGFRPGRRTQDCIARLDSYINRRNKYYWVIEGDIKAAFDSIHHKILIKLLTRRIADRRFLQLIEGFLKAGIMSGHLFKRTEVGTPQGGICSPILANIALHGLSQRIDKISPKARLIRYCDDFVVIHEDLQVIQQCQLAISLWLSDMGLSLKPSKTHISHTLKPYQGRVGFDFLGFTVRQFPVGKHQCGKIGCKGNNPKPLGFKTLIKPSQKALSRQVEKVGNIINAHRSANSQRLIQRLNPIIRGWARYYSTVVSKVSFEKLDNLVYQQLRAWARRRHPNKSAHWRVSKYWRTVGEDRWYFATTIENKIMRLFKYRETPIRRHIKVKGDRSPYDGDWIYWSTRQGRHPQTPTRVAKLLKQQQGKCSDCGLYFQDKDQLEVDHIIPISHGGKDIYSNLQLLHRHCHVNKSRVERNRNLDGKGMCDKHQISEEPNKPKGLCSVLKTSRIGNNLA